MCGGSLTCQGLSISSLFKSHCLDPQHSFSYDVFLSENAPDEASQSQLSRISSSQPRTPLRESNPEVQTPASSRIPATSPATQSFAVVSRRDRSRHKVQQSGENTTPNSRTITSRVLEEDSSQTRSSPARESAYRAMLLNAKTGMCEPIPLMCTTAFHYEEEMEL